MHHKKNVVIDKHLTELRNTSEEGTQATIIFQNPHAMSRRSIFQNDVVAQFQTNNENYLAKNGADKNGADFNAEAAFENAIAVVKKFVYGTDDIGCNVKGTEDMGCNVKATEDIGWKMTGTEDIGWKMTRTEEEIVGDVTETDEETLGNVKGIDLGNVKEIDWSNEWSLVSEEDPNVDSYVLKLKKLNRFTKKSAVRKEKGSQSCPQRWAKTFADLFGSSSSSFPCVVGILRADSSQKIAQKTDVSSLSSPSLKFNFAESPTFCACTVSGDGYTDVLAIWLNGVSNTKRESNTNMQNLDSSFNTTGVTEQSVTIQRKLSGRYTVWKFIL